MSDELSNATRIAALEADVVRLTAELQSEREDLAEKCKAYGDALVEETKLTSGIAALEEQVRQLTAAVTRECDRRIEETERLRCELDGQEATRKFRAAELHAVRLALDERNAYAERLLAENVRLTNEAAEVRHELDNALNQGAWLTNQLDQCHTWIDGQNVRSDFQTATAMRETLDSLRNSIYAACAGSGCLNAHELRVALDKERDDHANTTRALHNISKWVHGEDFRAEYPTATAMRNALIIERERCGVLEAEVNAWHAAEHLRKDEPHAEFKRLAEARARTRETNALDAAKFDQHKRGSIIECLDKVRDAGGHAWDKVANPDAVLRGDDDAAKFVGGG